MWILRNFALLLSLNRFRFDSICKLVYFASRRGYVDTISALLVSSDHSVSLSLKPASDPTAVMSATTGEDYMEPIPSCGTEAQTENPRYVNSEAERAESAIYHYTDIDIGIGVTSTGQGERLMYNSDV